MGYENHPTPPEFFGRERTPPGLANSEFNSSKAECTRCFVRGKARVGALGLISHYEWRRLRRLGSPPVLSQGQDMVGLIGEILAATGSGETRGPWRDMKTEAGA